MNATAAAIFALTFVSEDTAVLGAAALVAGGVLDWPVAFAAAFLGIWLGDLWLYGVARLFGAPALARYGSHSAFARSRSWFERCGAAVLLGVRFVPGLRLPSYLAAGAMRFPAWTFAVVTCVAALAWVALILAGGKAFGLWPAVVALCFFGVGAWWSRSGRSLRPSFFRTAAGSRHSLQALRPLHFEFWPAWLFYTPVALMYAWLGVRYRGWSLPAAANPGMPAGGLVGESKFDTLRLLNLVAPKHTAPTWLLEPADTEQRFQALKRVMGRGSVELPFVLKPDVGQRGAGVKLIRSLQEARDYLERVQEPVLLQRYAPGPHEAGVFYYRYPDDPTGHILAITEKVFPTIAGDGVRTVEQLILADPRASVIAHTYLRRFERERERVLAPGEMLRLVEAGNHAQGCIFRDGMHLATPVLRSAIDRISQSLPGFFIGRYDVRYGCDEELCSGWFTIVELNGAGSEATSIYDPHNSLSAAYRMLYRQWDLVFRIGAINRARGCAPPAIGELLRAWWRTTCTTRSYPVAD